MKKKNQTYHFNDREILKLKIQHLKFKRKYA